ncbi:MAG: ATP-binding protein [Gammaproteobacteria bacterium]|nr:ATP-binding protein [Gammaproteobacteria bacterium]
MTDGVSLRRRLTWYVIVILLVITTSSGIVIYRGTTQEADEIFSASLVQTARILDGMITRASIESNRAQLAIALERGPDAHEYERKLFFAIVGPDGQVLLNSRKAPEIPHEIINSGFSEFRYKDRKWLTYARESSHDDLLIIVGERSEIRQEITEYIGGGLLLPLIFLLPIVLWLLWQIIGVALKPLQHVTDQVRQQVLKDLKPIDVAGVPREISPLVTALNQMIADLDAAYARERRFVSDASHELRNPLAALLINVENALEENQGRETLDSLESMKTSIQRLSHLVSQLLKLSHFENPQAVREFEQVDLGQVCQRVVDALRPQAEAKNLQVELLLSRENCLLEGAESLLDSLVSNLLDNAIRYSGPGCRIRLRCYRAANNLLLAVDDSGPGLDAEQRQKVLARFYRAADTNSAGAGLGLSIVETIAQIHDARIVLSDSDLGGLCVTVQFKLS